MEHNAKNFCRTVISGNKQNLNKQTAEFRISILFQYFVRFGQMQYFSKVLKTDFKIQYIFNTFNTAWEPWTQFQACLKFR